jgi:hypothetical protein
MRVGVTETRRALGARDRDDKEGTHDRDETRRGARE